VLTRRQFFGGGLVTAAASGAVAGLAAEHAGESRLTLAGLIQIFGQEPVLATMADLPTPVDLREVRRRLSGPLRRERRATNRRRNAERHRDVILWCGIVRIDGVIDNLLALPQDLDYDGRNQRHGGRARGTIRKARLPWPMTVTEYETDTQQVHDVPADSRLVMDTRRTLGPVCTCEIVHVVGREIRLHLWSRSGEPYADTANRLERVATVGGLLRH